MEAKLFSKVVSVSSRCIPSCRNPTPNTIRMIDTIRARVPNQETLQFRPEIQVNEGSPPEGFTSFNRTGLADGSRGWSLSDKNTGLRISASPTGFSSIEISLPRVFSTRGNFDLICSPETLSHHYAELQRKLSSVFINAQILEFTRLDLTQQFWMDCKPVISALRLARHDLLRRDPDSYETKLGPHSFRLQSSNLNIAAYDKFYQMIKSTEGRSLAEPYGHLIGEASGYGTGPGTMGKCIALRCVFQDGQPEWFQSVDGTPVRS